MVSQHSDLEVWGGVLKVQDTSVFKTVIPGSILPGAQHKGLHQGWLLWCQYNVTEEDSMQSVI